MKDIKIKAKDFFDASNDNLSLSILVNKNGLSYSLFSEEEKQFVALIHKEKKTNENFNDFFISFYEQEKFDNLAQRNTIVFTTTKKTIVPNSIFDKDRALNLFKTVHELSDSEIIQYKEIPCFDSYIIYAVNKIEYQLLLRALPESNITCDAFLFLQNSFNKAKQDENRANSILYVNISYEYFDVVVLNENFRLFNTFKYKSSNDILYHIINIYNKLKLSPEKTPTEISGFIEPSDIAIINLRKFIRFVYFSTLNPSYKYFYRFQEIMPHYFSNFLLK